MLLDHVQIRGTVLSLGDVKIFVLLLSPAFGRVAYNLVRKPEDFDEVTRKVQCDDYTKFMTLAYFNITLKIFKH